MFIYAMIGCSSREDPRFNKGRSCDTGLPSDRHSSIRLSGESPEVNRGSPLSHDYREAVYVTFSVSPLATTLSPPENTPAL
jgi:hypothetical protein